MALLKKFIFTILILFMVFIAVGYFLPTDYRVQRDSLVSVPAEDAYAQVVDLKNWKDWGVWFQRDPDMQLSYTGDDAIGMKSTWDSVSEGQGEMTITAIEPGVSVTYKLYFANVDISSIGQLTVVETDGQTLVSWVVSGDVGRNPINRYFAMVMDSLLGPDLEESLDNLKTLLEK